MRKQKNSFGNILLEILIVIIGISIAFWVNNWGEEKKERALEKEFLRSLKSELVSDSLAFDAQVKVNLESVKHLGRFAEICRNQDYDNDSIQWFIGMFLNRGNWVLNSNTYEMLKSGGNLDIITDFELRTAISEFYHLRGLQTSKILDIIQEFLDSQMHPYLTKNTSYFISYKPDQGFVRDQEFQNLLVIWLDFTDAKLDIYQGVLADIRSLMPMLEESLK